MSKKTIAVVMVATMLTLFGLGCMKMETEITIHPNGSVSGSTIIAIDEVYWNMSEGMNTSMGDFDFIDTENVTVWREDGWVYLESDEMVIPEENISLEVRQYPGYTEYEIDADTSELQEAGDEEMNFSDPFTQILLSSMTIEFTFNMPGEIIDTNAHQFSGSTATWSYTGTSIQNVDNIYVKSRAYVSETVGFLLVGIPVAAILGRLRRRTR